MRTDDTTLGSDLLGAATRLSDSALLAKVGDLSDRSRQVTVELIAHLAEVERRALYRAEGCGRLFTYCTEILKFSEAAAWNRVRAARAARRFPVVLEMLADGRVNLTTIRLLEPHLTVENHRALLDEARGLSRREVDTIVARLSPRPDVPSSVRPVVALAPGRYRLDLTIGEEPHDDLRYLQDRMRREIPDGDPAEIVSRALHLLRREVDRKAFSAAEKARPARGATPGSRHVEAHVKRTVWARDEGRCAFVARNGRRCSERSYLEFHHLEPYGIGGEPTVANIALRCRAHNQYESELVFGPFDATALGDMAAARRRGTKFRTGPGTSPRRGSTRGPVPEAGSPPAGSP